MSKEDLDRLVARKEQKDEFHGRDLQFDRVNLNPNWENEDPADLSDEAEEDFMSDDDLDDVGGNPDGPRCSKRLRS